MSIIVERCPAPESLLRILAQRVKEAYDDLQLARRQYCQSPEHPDIESAYDTHRQLSKLYDWASQLASEQVSQAQVTAKVNSTYTDIDLTPGQQQFVARWLDAANEAASENAMGMVLAQMFKTYMRVGFVDMHKASRIRAELQ